MSDTPIVFVPGLLCDARLWRDQAAALSDLAPSIIADVTLDDSVEAMAARLLADAPARFALVGLSMGGYVAFEVLRQARERVAAVALSTPWRRRTRQRGGWNGRRRWRRWRGGSSPA